MEMIIRWLLVLTIMWVRYILIAGLAYMVFYVWGKRKFIAKKIQQTFPPIKSINREFKYSSLTMLIFSLVGVGIAFARMNGYTLIYSNFHAYPRGYFLLSIVLAILMHDTYFYWTHRWMHRKRIFKHVHRVHHLSNNPTPLAAFSFHPIEAIVEAGILPIIAFALPMHIGAIFIYLLYMIIMNVMGHCGFEFFPKWFVKIAPFKWYNTSTHHNMHHHYAKGNYGLYFNVWDRIMKTNHPEYEKNFEKVATREEEKISASV